MRAPRPERGRAVSASKVFSTRHGTVVSSRGPRERKAKSHEVNHSLGNDHRRQPYFRDLLPSNLDLARTYANGLEQYLILKCEPDFVNKSCLHPRHPQKSFSGSK